MFFVFTSFEAQSLLPENAAIKIEHRSETEVSMADIRDPLYKPFVIPVVSFEDTQKKGQILHCSTIQQRQRSTP